MTFPEKKISDAGRFADAYFEHIAKAAASVDRSLLNDAASLLAEAYRTGKSVFSCGNGGSAAISNHLHCDHLKGCRTDTGLLSRVHSLSANLETITAVANDISYDEVFAYQLQSLGSPDDVLITISSSGDSENIVRACQWARDNGLHVIAMTGFSGGRSASLASVNLHVDADNYGVIEDVHQSLMHILAQSIRMAHMPEDLIAERKF